MSMEQLNNFLKTGKLVLLTQLKVVSQVGSAGCEALLLLWYALEGGNTHITQL